MNQQAIREAIAALDAEREQIDHAVDTLWALLGVPASMAEEEQKPLVANPHTAEEVAAYHRRCAARQRAEAFDAALKPPPTRRRTKKPSAEPPMRQAKRIKRLGNAKLGTRVIDRTLAVLQKAGKPMSVADISAAINHPARSLPQTLSHYVKWGVLVHTGRSEFGLPGHQPTTPTQPKPDLPLSGNGRHLLEPHEHGMRCSRCGAVRKTISEFIDACRGKA